MVLQRIYIHNLYICRNARTCLHTRSDMSPSIIVYIHNHISKKRKTHTMYRCTSTHGWDPVANDNLAHIDINVYLSSGGWKGRGRGEGRWALKERWRACPCHRQRQGSGARVSAGWWSPAQRPGEPMCCSTACACEENGKGQAANIHIDKEVRIYVCANRNVLIHRRAYITQQKCNEVVNPT